MKKAYSDFIVLRAGLFALMLTLSFSQVFSQAASPYSRYGLGYIESTVFSANKGMGEVAAPYASAVNINYTNPASYASLTRTTVQIGANVEGLSILTRDSTYSSAGAGISHFAIAFVPNPKHNNWAISVGIVPVSMVNYNFAQAYSDSVIGNYYQAYTGSGSLYNVYVGGAYKIKGFSIGANIGYTFGKLEYQKLIEFPDTAYAFNTRNITDVNMGGVSYSVGVQYQRLIYKNVNDPDPRSQIYAMFGLYGSGGTKLTTKTSTYWDRFSYDASSNIIVSDTLQSTFKQKGTITMPYNIGGGLMFGNELYWLVGADFKYTNWKNFSSPLDNGSLANSYRISFGAQITPKYDDRNYLKRIQYRAGFYTGKSEINISGLQLTENAGTVGIGFPLKKVAPFKELGTINVTGEFGSRGGNDKSLIRENYYRFTFGFVLNDIWFIKRKFD
ncbi:MAG: hypothetical protein JWO06_3543 [Bacteroidota bacterium]|nr:hypothetical protein [Bacteroidota bacterium]